MSRTEVLTIKASDSTGRSSSVPISITWTDVVSNVKDRVYGMRDRGGNPHPAGAPVAVHVPISAIAPTHNTLNMKPLQDAIAAAKKTGAYACTISLDGGTEESADAKSFFGGVTLQDPQGLRPDHTTVLFSTAAYQERAEEIVAATAAIVEPDPFCREYILWWNGAEFSAEWPIREASYAPNRAAWLANSKYNIDQDAANCVAGPAMYARHFTNTRMYTWMPMGFQRISSSGVKQDMTVNTAFLENMLRYTPTGVLGVDNADLKSYGPGRPAIYELALTYAKKGLERSDQTVTTVKMGSNGPLAVQQFFQPTNLQKMVDDMVYCIEYPRGSNMTEAQFKAAHDFIVAAAR